MARTRFIPPKPHADGGVAWRRSRLCAICGDVYTRRNLTEMWDARNEGHRSGWHKTVMKICNKCLSAATAKRVLVLAQVKPSGAAGKAAP